MTDLQQKLGHGGSQENEAEAAFVEKLKELAEKWKAQHGKDLEIRYETGVVLNERFKEPTERQKRGDEVLKGAAKQLGVHESDLSRMRWFAHLFKSPDDLRSQHPDVTNWTSFKDLPPQLQRQRAGSGQSSSGASTPKKTHWLRTVKGALQKISTAEGEKGIALTPEEAKDLLAQFMKVAQAIGGRLRVRVSVEEVKAESTPPPADEGEIPEGKG